MTGKYFLTLFIMFSCISCTIIKLYTCENIETRSHTYILPQTTDTISDSTTLVIDKQQIIITNNNEKYTITGLRIK